MNANPKISDNKTKLINTLNYVSFFSALLLTATSIYSYPAQKIPFILFFSSYFLEMLAEKKWKYIHFEKKSIYFFIMVLFYLLALLYFPFEHSSTYFSKLIVKRLPIFGFAIIGLLGVNRRFKLNFFLNTFIISSIVAIVYLLFIRIGISEFITSPLREDIFTKARNLYVNSHMEFNFYLNVSLISIWYVLTQFWKMTIWWKKILYIGAFIFIFSTLSISEGRSGFVASILLVISFIFVDIWKRKKLIGLVVGILTPFLLISIVSHQRRMSKESLKAEPRIFLWESALYVIKEKPIFGYGISDAQEHFDIARTKFQTDEYRENWKAHKLLDSHSQYLQTTMEHGIIGLIILLFLYTYPVFLANKNRKLFSFLLLFLCAYQSVFDMFITGKFSAMFCILVILILSVENNISLEEQKKSIIY
jgi:Lipid A core - O-antigen ligase and related enzymes